MTVEEIRKANINYWADKLGRNILAQKIGYQDTVYINQLCGGHGSFGKRTARKLEKALGLAEGEFDTINAYTLINGKIQGEPAHDGIETLESFNGNVRKLPLISFAQAGAWGEAMDPYELNDAEDWLPSPIEHTEKAFLIRIQGVSMHNPYDSSDGYPDGAIAQFEPLQEAMHNDDVLVRTPDGKVAFKRLQSTNEGKHLIAINPDYPNRIIQIPEDSVICGVCTGYWLKKKRG